MEEMTNDLVTRKEGWDREAGDWVEGCSYREGLCPAWARGSPRGIAP